MEFLGVLAAIVLILTPIPAISAFVRIQHLNSQLRSFPLQDLAARLSAIKQHLAAHERSKVRGRRRGIRHRDDQCRDAIAVQPEKLFLTMII